MFASHSWPRWGNARIQEVMRTQRDTYANLNNQSLHYANQRRDHQPDPQRVPAPEEPAAAVGRAQLPRLRAAQQPRRDQPLPRLLGRQPGDADPALAGGFRAALRRDDGRRRARSWPRASSCNDQGKYLEAVEILNRLVFAEPKNQAAKDLLADVFEQIGYQKESPSLRNSFLQGAYELRSGLPGGVAGQADRAGRGPRHVDRATGSTSSASAWIPGGRRDEVRHQPGDARQRREVPGRDEQRDADQHQGRAGDEAGSDHYRRTAPI